jgi:hypothetical protein
VAGADATLYSHISKEFVLSEMGSNEKERRHDLTHILKLL